MEGTKVRYIKVYENILISVLVFFIFRRKSCKKKKNHRVKWWCVILGLSWELILEATQLVAEMEEVGLIRFGEFGNVGLLELEGQS